MNFYTLSSHLKKIGFKVGVAIPSICENFSLIIKIRSDEVVYHEHDIAFALKVLKISAGQSSTNEKIFSKITCELNNFDLELRKNSVQNTNKLISLLDIIKDINISHDQTETQFILKKTDDKWRFFVTLDSLDTAAESIKYLIFLYKKYSKIPNFEWKVGNLNIHLINSAPYIFLLRNSKIEAVLTDYLDILIFCSVLRSENNDMTRSCQRFENLLSVNSLKNTFSQEKVDYALELQRILNDDSSEIHLDKLFSVKSTCGSIKAALEILRSISKNDKTQLFYSVYEIALATDEGLHITLEEAGFSKYDMQNIKINDWSQLQTTVQNFLNEKNPIYAKTKMVCDVISNSESNGFKKNDIESAGVCIEDLIDSKNVPCEILEELKRWRTRTEETTPTRLTKIHQTLQKFLTECKSKTKELIHLDVLIEICKMNQKAEDEDNFRKYKKIAEVYIGQISLTDSFDDTIKKKINDDVEQNKTFLALRTLSKCCQATSLQMFYKHIEKFKDTLKERNPLKELLSAASKFKDNEKQSFLGNCRYKFVQAVTKFSILDKGCFLIIRVI